MPSLARLRLVPFAAPALVLGVLGFSSGGYFPSAWGLLLAGTGLGLAAVAILRPRAALSRLHLVLVAALLAFAAWSGVSAAWSSGGPAVQEAQRNLVVVAVVVLACLVLTAGTVTAFAAGVVAAVVVEAGYGLATRLYPGDVGGSYDPSSGYQLAEPLGYWNALGLLLAFGALLALGLARGGGRLAQAASAAALVPIATALFFTFSRGALLALAVGLAAGVILDGRAGRALAEVAALAAAPATAVWLASRQDALTAPGATLETAQTQGHDLGWRLLVLTALAGALAPAALAALRRPRLRRPAEVAAALLATAVLALAVAGAVVHFDGPAGIYHRALEAFREEPDATSPDLQRRLLTASGHGRAAYWRVAAGMVVEHPLLGAGAATFERNWLRDRPVPHEARDAHNLYLETLAELGPLGLLLLVGGLVVPLARVGHLRGDPLGVTLAGAYAAFLVHAAIDWDWEIPALTLTALACGVALLARTSTRPARAASRMPAAALAAAGVVVVVAGVVTHLGNRAVEASDRALAEGRLALAAAEARTARRWMPWSAQPWELLGAAKLAAGRDTEARDALEEAVRRDPGMWSAWLALGAIPPTSERALDRAAALNPLSAEVRDLRQDILTES